MKNFEAEINEESQKYGNYSPKYAFTEGAKFALMINPNERITELEGALRKVITNGKANSHPSLPYKQFILDLEKLLDK